MGSPGRLPGLLMLKTNPDYKLFVVVVLINQQLFLFVIFLVRPSLKKSYLKSTEDDDCLMSILVAFVNMQCVFVMVRFCIRHLFV